MNFDDAIREDLSGRVILHRRLQLVKKLGAGAFGAVYLAKEYAFDRPLREVAVKLTHEKNLSPEAACERLQEGYSLCRLLLHAGNAKRFFIQVYEMGIAEDCDNRAYLIMEYVPGVRLMDHIRPERNGVPMSIARRYLGELCEALAVCHSLTPALTHGDLKPDNILVDEQQSLRVVDFGLAKPIDRLTGYAVTQSGCLAYTAPETLLGRGYPQSDIYGIGLIMYEVLRGDGPHLHIPPPENRQSLAYYFESKQTMTFEPLTSANQSVSQDHGLFEIVERCLRFD
ncbi:MAG: serine/threonine protein kinase, partial [Planctomycetaceae bacterium]|nr:serine/threonine protein kinase [Planctomycetaceae bacterium]